MTFPATLILGGNGRIAQLFRRDWAHLLPPDSDLRWQMRRPSGEGAQEGTRQTHPDVRIFSPIEDPAALVQAAQGCDVILCLAGSIAGRGADLQDNWRLAEAALQAAAAAGPRAATGRCAQVFLASSAAVYGNQPGPLSEDSPLAPASPYGAAKAEMEQRAAALAARLDVPVCMLRIGNIAGLDAILGGWRAGFALDQFADGRSPQRSYIGMRCLSRVVAQLLQRAILSPAALSPSLPAVLNLAQPGPVAMGDLLRAADLPFASRPAPQTAIAEVSLDVSRLQRLIPAELLPQANAAQMIREWRALAPAAKSAPKPVPTPVPEQETDPR
jgi:UDP-glucose 4-epimerase